MGHILKELDRIAVNIDRDLFFQLLCVRIFPCAGKIIFFSHRRHPLTKVLPAFVLCCPSGRNDPDDGFGRSIAMADHK